LSFIGIFRQKGEYSKTVLTEHCFGIFYGFVKYSVNRFTICQIVILVHENRRIITWFVTLMLSKTPNNHVYFNTRAQILWNSMQSFAFFAVLVQRKCNFH
jgi:hypothetical protein